MIKLIRIFEKVLFGYCICGLIAAVIPFLLALSGVRLVSSTLKLPLGTSPCNITADTNGNIYYLSTFYCRLQVFDKSGHFLRGWFIPVGNAELFTDPNGFLHVIGNGDRHLIFDIKGNLINEKLEPGLFKKVVRQNENKVVQDAEGNMYYIQSQLPYTKIVRVTSSYEKKVVITDLNFLWPLRMPFPLFFCLFFTALIYGIKKTIKEKKMKEEKQAS
ncbi:MAG: hypothetical protein ACYS67_14865 [Planctomycetota bacterium]|jgi:hypothetical protein